MSYKEKWGGWLQCKMREVVFAKEISCPSARQQVKAIKKAANSIKNHLLATDACISYSRNIAIAWKHKSLPNNHKIQSK
jgi:hypothetical protein